MHAAYIAAVHHAAENQERMAEEGGIDMLVAMLGSTHPHLQRQASKALANLGVNAKNKEIISKAGGVGPLVKLAGSKRPGVAVEAVAALANLAVNGESISDRYCVQTYSREVGTLYCFLHTRVIACFHHVNRVRMFFLFLSLCKHCMQQC